MTGAAEDRAPLLSVVLPNYNHARFLPRALEALLAQDRPPDEIIVVDDASADDSLAVLAAIKARHPGLVVVRNARNEGAVAALQRGLEMARGRFVYFAAADDLVLPGFFSLALSMLLAHPDRGLFCADAVLLDGGSGRPLGRRPAVRPRLRAAALTPADAHRLFRRGDNFILTGSTVFRRDLVLAKGGFDARAGSFSDGILARKIALTHGFCYAPATVATWNVFADGVSRTTALDPQRARLALATLPALLAEDPDFPAWYARIFGDRWRFAVARLALGRAAPDSALLVEMAGKTGLDRQVLAALARRVHRPEFRLAALAWISLRLRPYRISDVALTSLVRRLEARRAGRAAGRPDDPREVPDA